MAVLSALKVKIFKEIVAEDGGSFKEVESVVESALGFARRRIENGDMQTIRFPYFGKFHVNPYRLKKLNDAIFQRGESQDIGGLGDQGGQRVQEPDSEGQE